MRHLARLAASAAALAVLAGACGAGTSRVGAAGGSATSSTAGGTSTTAATVAPRTGASTTTVTTAPPTTVTTRDPNAPSQSAADARRDGVVPELAALPFSVRVGITASAPAAEGVWVISRPTAAASRYTKGCRLGPETGTYPTQTICTTEYGEVLLLSADRARILRAYPLPSVPATLLRLTPDAVYCARQGDTQMSEYTLPDSMVCRIDRRSLKPTVHVFATAEGSEVLQPCFTTLPNWTVTKGWIPVASLQPDAQGLAVNGADGTRTVLDPVSLAVITAASGPSSHAAPAPGRSTASGGCPA